MTFTQHVKGEDRPVQVAEPDARPEWVRSYRAFWKSVLAVVTEVSVLMTIGLTVTAIVTTLSMTGTIGDEWLYVIPTWWTAVSGWGAIYYGRAVNKIGPKTTRHAVSTPAGTTISPGVPLRYGPATVYPPPTTTPPAGQTEGDL